MLLLIVVLAQGPRFVELQPGMVITQSIVVAPKTYRFSGPPIRIRGENITVDFRGAVLEGMSPDSAPDQAKDTAIVVEYGRTVRIENARIRGYKIGILARGTHGLESNTVERGMNGLLLVGSGGLMIRGNDFSFNSGLGIGLYRSSDDTIFHNRLDYNVRGYSHGRYTRGQDSADLLLFERSSRNVVALNSMTHGGDGIFLWAGQTTMDSGTGGGGANDTLFYGNDVSYATANVVEITFSKNQVIANRAWGSEYGVWG